MVTAAHSLCGGQPSAALKLASPASEHWLIFASFILAKHVTCYKYFGSFY